MRKGTIVTLIFFLVMSLLQPAFTVQVSAANGFAGGNGSAGNPYEIENADQLNQIRDHLSSHFVLTNDIDLEGFGNWEPINSFTGTLDGQNYTIFNLSIDDTENGYSGTGDSSEGTGFFGGVESSSALIENLRLRNVDVRGNTNVGGLAGYYRNGKIENVYVEGEVRGNFRVGGIVGRPWSASMDNQIVFIGSVEGRKNVGGLAGRSSGTTTIGNAYVRADVNGITIDDDDPQEIGLGVGNTSGSDSDFESIYVAGTVSAEGDAESVGAFTGEIITSGTTFNSVFWTSEDQGDQGLAGVKPGNWKDERSKNYSFLEPDEMKGDNALDNMTGFDFGNTWVTIPNDYPVFEWQAGEEQEEVTRTISFDGFALACVTIEARPNDSTLPTVHTETGDDGSFTFSKEEGNGLFENSRYQMYLLYNNGQEALIGTIDPSEDEQEPFDVPALDDVITLEKPTLSFIGYDTGTWTDEDVEVELTADADGEIMFYQINDEDWVRYEEPFTISEEGEHKVRAHSSLNNCGDIALSDTTDPEDVWIDKTPPEIEWAPDGNPDLATEQATVVTVTDALSDVDADSLLYQWTASDGEAEDGEWTGFASGEELTFETEKTGDYVLHVRASDEVGNDVETASEVFAVESQVSRVERLISGLPDEADVDLNDEADIGHARGAFDELSDDRKQEVGNPERLEAAEDALLKLEQEIDKVNDLIDALDRDITLSDEDAIREAREGYEALSTLQKERIDNLNTLAEAEETLSVIQVKALIEDLPDREDMDLGDKKAVNDAREAYDALSDEQKNDVGNLDRLTAAEDAISELEEDVASVEEAISDLPDSGDIRLSDEGAVESARDSYDDLSDGQKESVNNLERLEEAELVIEERRQAIADLNEEIDSLPDPVTYSDRDRITDIREQYEAFGDDQKQEVSQERVEKLEASEEEIQALQEAIDQVTAAIEALPDPVTYSDREDVKKVNEQYGALADDQKDGVDAATVTVLEEAMTDVEDLEQAVTEVNDAIEALPAEADLDLGQADEVEAVRAMFDSLADDQQQDVLHPGNLETAEARVQELREEVEQVIEAIEALPETIRFADRQQVQEVRNQYDRLSADQQQEVEPAKIERLTEAEGEIRRLRPSPPPVEQEPEETVEERLIDVTTDDPNEVLVQTPVSRTTASDGRVTDRVDFDGERALEAIGRLQETGGTRSSIVIPDNNNEVDEFEVTVRQEAVTSFNQNNIDIRVETDHARVTVPAVSTNGFDEELFFRIVPEREPERLTAVRERGDDIMREASLSGGGNGSYELVDIPRTIETNYTGMETEVALPLPEEVLVPENLRVLIEHSDGERVVVDPRNGDASGRFVTDDDGNVTYIAFTIDKFSQFTFFDISASEADAEDGVPTFFDEPLLFTGTANPDQTLIVEINGDEVGVVTTDEEGNWTFELEDPELTDGAHALTLVNDAGERSDGIVFQYYTVYSYGGYLHGYPDGTFRPEEDVLRSQVAAMLARHMMDGYVPEAENHLFRDALGHWSADYLGIVREAGLMIGYSDGTFGVDDELTRAQVAVIADRWVTMACEDDGDGRYCHDELTAQSYTDLADSHWAAESINRISGLGITKGYGDQSFRPDQTITRAETVTMLNRMFELGPLYGVDKPTFSDVDDAHWAFHHIEKAGTDHRFILRRDDETGDVREYVHE